MIDREGCTVNNLINHYYEFLQRFNIDLSYYKLDIVCLKDIAKRYWRDVDRLHQFHEIERINSYKIAGYTTYWISKLRPIHAQCDEAYLQNAKTALFINELFALYVAFGRIYSSLESREEHKGTALSHKFIKSFIYTLKYRTTTGDNLALIYYLIESRGG